MENGNEQRLTIGVVRRHLVSLSPRIVVKRTQDDEFRVSVGDCEQSAYYASDLQDALGTGEHMALHAAGWRMIWNEVQSIYQWTATGQPMMERTQALSALKQMEPSLFR
jgi:hypothetical protein